MAQKRKARAPRELNDMKTGWRNATDAQRIQFLEWVIAETPPHGSEMGLQRLVTGLRMAPYGLELTAGDVRMIARVGGRYCWAAALLSMTEGPNEISETEAREICAAFKRDTEKGHSPFPMLFSVSTLHGKLTTSQESVV